MNFAPLASPDSFNKICLVGPLGDVFTIGKKLTSAFGGPLLAIFVLALFSRRSNWQAVLISVSIATVVTLVLMTTQTDWFSVWFWPIGFFLALFPGFAASYLFPAKPTELTYVKIMRQPKS